MCSISVCRWFLVCIWYVWMHCLRMCVLVYMLACVVNILYEPDLVKRVGALNCIAYVRVCMYREIERDTRWEWRGELHITQKEPKFTENVPSFSLYWLVIDKVLIWTANYIPRELDRGCGNIHTVLHINRIRTLLASVVRWWKEIFGEVLIWATPNWPTTRSVQPAWETTWGSTRWGISNYS